MLKFQSLHLIQYTYQDIFPTAQNSFWTRQFLILLVLLLFFVSPLPISKMFPFKDFFHLGKQNKTKSHSGTDPVNREGAEWKTPPLQFSVKNCWTLSTVWAGVLVSHPSWNGQKFCKNIQKNSLKRTQPLTTAPAGTLIRMGS